jgi:ATP-dependent helicase/nuclease subunit B
VTQPTYIEVPVQQNLLQYTADFILQSLASQTASIAAPDFSNLFVLLPHAAVTSQFNEALSHTLDENTAAIIPPWSGTLKDWLSQFTPSSGNQSDDYQVINEHARQLLFIEALQEYPHLFKEENQWQVTQALLKLFDELNLNQQNLFESETQWQQQLEQAYGIEQQDRASQEQNFEHLQFESKLVYTLWHAWKTQLEENKHYDETADFISRLSQAPAAITGQQHFICLCLSSYSKSEQSFIQHLIANQQCHIIEYEKTLNTNNVDNKHALSAFISETFTPSANPIKQRARDYASKFQHAFTDKPPFHTFLASDEEQQIRAIDFFVRSQLLAGKNNIAIISEDRKLSRRLRALLERADIQLQDKAGWSLATTQAATIVERWLECIEEDFSAYPLLDCLKSPYFDISASIEQNTELNNIDFKQDIYRFEHDLIFHENITSNISRYKKQLKKRLQRLTHWPRNSYKTLTATLTFIENNASELSSLHKKNKKIRLSVFLQALLSSLQQMGILENYQHDEAGLTLLKTFDSLKHSLQYADPELNWQDCRIWLGMALDAQHFTPTTNSSSVQLMTLSQASHLYFDCVIITSVQPQHYPGSANNDPFFNQSVRASLQLSTWEEQREQRHELFNRTLLSAPEVLLTACNEENGEAKPVSPWLELLISFYQLAFTPAQRNATLNTGILENHSLHELVDSQAEVFNCDEKDLPQHSQQATSNIPSELIPERMSASSYQRLINCPYQYFSADALRLKPLEELSDELRKSDYGERIHFILQVFHHGHDKFGAAFKPPINEDNKTQAVQYLTELSEKVFLNDLENNVLHRSWLYRWKKHIPAYIEWQIKQQLEWMFYQSEESLEQELAGLTLYGRVDRIDRNRENDTHAIIDYKTGKTARQEDVDSGENVQLSTYALLDNEASEVSYLSVDSSDQKVASKSCLNADALDANRELNKQRLMTLFEQIKNKQQLPAWGDDSVCRFCDFSGLCRKQEWSE